MAEENCDCIRIKFDIAKNVALLLDLEDNAVSEESGVEFQLHELHQSLKRHEKHNCRVEIDLEKHWEKAKETIMPIKTKEQLLRKWKEVKPEFMELIVDMI